MPDTKSNNNILCYEYFACYGLVWSDIEIILILDLESPQKLGQDDV